MVQKLQSSEPQLRGFNMQSYKMPWDSFAWDTISSVTGLCILIVNVICHYDNLNTTQLVIWLHNVRTFVDYGNDIITMLQTTVCYYTMASLNQKINLLLTQAFFDTICNILISKTRRPILIALQFSNNCLQNVCTNNYAIYKLILIISGKHCHIKAIKLFQRLTNFCFPFSKDIFDKQTSYFPNLYCMHLLLIIFRIDYGWQVPIHVSSGIGLWILLFLLSSHSVIRYLTMWENVE